LLAILLTSITFLTLKFFHCFLLFIIKLAIVKLEG